MKTPARIHGRALKMSDVNDLVALRIVLKARKWHRGESNEVTAGREAFLCYYVQKLCMECWPATDEGSNKDYIRFPKRNGYMSLHYTASVFRGGEDWPFEVQVRSKEMHYLAKFGVASHWDYKLSGGHSLPASSSLTHKKNTALALLPASKAPFSTPTPQTTASTSKQSSFPSPYIEALSTARTKLAQTNVYVFVLSPQDSPVNSDGLAPRGTILTLPLGATVGDALNECRMSSYNVETRDDHFVSRNGAWVGEGTRLENGDALIFPFCERIDGGTSFDYLQ